jgi:hypothetical protein
MLGKQLQVAIQEHLFGLLQSYFQGIWHRAAFLRT